MPAGETGVVRNLDLTSLVRRWVDGSEPNNGLLLRISDESLVNGKLSGLASDDISPGMRPKLVVTYTDGSGAHGPRVSLTSPTAGSTVLASPVLLAASAEDDRRVDRVEFLADGVSLGVDTTAPFERSWTLATNGSHTITLRGTDDAGNVSQGVAQSLQRTCR